MESITITVKVIIHLSKQAIVRDFFRILLKLTSAEWTQVQSTALETPYAITVIYSTVSDSGETARFGFWKFNKTTVYKKLAFETSENYRLVDWSIAAN